MNYYIQNEGSQVIAKVRTTDTLDNDYIEISKELFDKIGALPCSFQMENGEIINIEYIEPRPKPPPEPTETELLRQEMGSLLLDQAMDKMKISELEKSQGDLLMEIAMLKMGGAM